PRVLVWPRGRQHLRLAHRRDRAGVLVFLHRPGHRHAEPEAAAMAAHRRSVRVDRRAPGPPGLHRRASQPSADPQISRGFTLVEAMVVVAIVAILALMALPSYQDKLVRDQILEALPLGDVAKPPITVAAGLKLPFPADNAAAGLPPAEKIVSNLVSSVAVEGGAIHISFGNRVNGAIKGKVLSVRPAVVE